MHRKSMSATALACSLALGVSACAKNPGDIAAAYVSPLGYESYSCEQLAAEAQRVSSRAAQVMGVQQDKAQGDAVAVGVGLILFWPALFFVKGNGATEGEIARLKGEMDAIEQVSIHKECGLSFQRPEPPKRKVARNPNVNY